MREAPPLQLARGHPCKAASSGAGTRSERPWSAGSQLLMYRWSCWRWRPRGGCALVGTTRGLPKGAVGVQQHAGVAFNFNGATTALQCHGSDAYTIPFPS